MDYNEANQFIKEYILDPERFIYKPRGTFNDVIIDIPELRVQEFDLATLKDQDDNFNDDDGHKVNITNWSVNENSEDQKFFYDKYFPVVCSTWHDLIIKASDHLYVKLDREMVYEWDDGK